jgi:hypothetical protein
MTQNMRYDPAFAANGLAMLLIVFMPSSDQYLGSGLSIVQEGIVGRPAGHLPESAE